MINTCLQWLGTTALIAMYVVMSFYPQLHPLNILLGLCGGVCYFAWSYRVGNRPQQLVNMAGILVCAAGLLKVYL